MKYDECVRLLRTCKRLEDARCAEATVTALTHNTFLLNLVVDMYGRCGSIEEARRSFDKIAPSRRNIYTFNLLLKAYIVNHRLDMAEHFFFNEMPCPGPVAATTLIGAYGTLPDPSKMINAKAAFDFTQRDSGTWNALLFGYSKHRMLQETKECYDKMPQHCVVSWTSLFAVFAMKGDLQLGMEIFLRMPSRDDITWENVVMACNKNQDVGLANEVFLKIPMHTLVSSNLLLAANAREGHLREAKFIFDSMAYRDGISWSNMLAAYAQAGQAGEAVCWFHQLQMEGMLPDAVTFLWMFVSLSHLGDVHRGREIFLSMLGDYCIRPDRDHCVSMSVLLGRAGRLQEAEELIQDMPFWPDIVAWQALLVACKHHKDVRRAERASKEALRLGGGSSRSIWSDSSLTCVVLCNSYRDCAVLDEISL